MPDFNWNVLDHRWNNFKNWFAAMESVKEQKPYVTIESLRRMIDCVDKMSDKVDDVIIEALMKEDPQ